MVMREGYVHGRTGVDLKVWSIQARFKSVQSRVLLAFTYRQLVQTESEFEQKENARSSFVESSAQSTPHASICSAQGTCLTSVSRSWWPT